MFIALVPSYNEEKNIEQVVKSLLSFVDEVVVVDDFSSDATAVVAESSGATVIRHILNRGQGAALETGHCYARERNADYVLHFDGDGQFDVNDIPAALEKLKKADADILFGSRFLDNRSQIPWTKKKIILPIGRFVDRILSKTKLSDSHNGFRILNKLALQNIILTQDRMAHASEMLVLVKKNNLKWLEYPVKVNYSEYGQNAKNGGKILLDLLIGKFLKS